MDPTHVQLCSRDSWTWSEIWGDEWFQSIRPESDNSTFSYMDIIWIIEAYGTAIRLRVDRKVEIVTKFQDHWRRHSSTASSEESLRISVRIMYRVRLKMQYLINYFILWHELFHDYSQDYCDHHHHHHHHHIYLITRKPTRPNAVRNDASARAPGLSSASCDLDLWPPDPKSWPLHLLAPYTTYVNLQQNRFFRFQNILFTSLVTDEWTLCLRSV